MPRATTSASGILSTASGLVFSGDGDGNIIALDSKTGKEILALMDELHAQGNTIILVTHDTELSHRAARVVRLSDGQIVSDERNHALRTGA